LVSSKAMAIRFRADDEQLRPMGRATSGVVGMRFAGGDELLSMCVIRGGDGYLLTATEGGFGKRTRLAEYGAQGRGGKGVFTMKIVSTRGRIVGALVVGDDDQLFAITSNGGVIRTSAGEVRKTARQTMGVRLMNLPGGVTLLAVARNADEDDALPPDNPQGGSAT